MDIGMWAFLGGFIAVAVGIGILVAVIRRKIRRASQRLLGTADLVGALSAMGEQEAGPRSLNGYDQFVIPQILKDFPDFDATAAITYAKEYIRAQLEAQKSVKIHRVVYAQYLPSAAQKTIVFQAAVEYQEKSSKVQKRYVLHYCYKLPSNHRAVATNCPNCGANLSFGMRDCPYCGSRVVNVLGNTWEFTEMREG